MNPKDPIAATTSPNAQQLLAKFGAVANGFSAQDVIDAALNIVVNGLRQSHAARAAAESAWDEYVARAKGNLMNCYDAAGRKKGIYPYDQHITVGRVKR